MVTCAVVQCSTNSKRDHLLGVKFYAVPAVITNQCSLTLARSKRRRSLWLSRINIKDLTDKTVKPYTRVCSKHFISGVPAKLFDETNPDWAPSVNMGYSTNKCVTNERYNRSLKIYAGKKCLANTAAAALATDSADSASFNTADPDSLDQNREENFPGSPPEFSPVPAEVENEESNNQNSGQSGVADLTTRACLEDVSNTMGTECKESATESSVVHKQYLELSTAYRKLRDQLTEVENDKLELQTLLVDKEEVLEGALNRNEELYKKNCDLVKGSLESTQIIVGLQDRISKLTQDLDQMKKKCKDAEICTFRNFHMFRSNNVKVKFYTGLPNYEMFDSVLCHLSIHYKQSTMCVLAPWQSLLMTLMRLRLALPLQDLAYRFDVSVATACRTFEKWVHLMYVYLYPVLVHWPDRETLYKTMPAAFKESFGKSVAVIVDCFEIFTEKPSALDSRAKTWSNYKHHNTVKCLIGITPCGAVSFISLSWGGRVSDKLIAAQSGLYEHLLPHDVVMADRGFDISEDVGFYCARVLIPAFTKNQDQLSSHDVELTRKIAHLRIHIERVIGLVRRKYTILQSNLPVEMLTKKLGQELAPIDEIVRVCCALTNLCNSVVSTDNE